VTILHVTNGDSAIGQLASAGFPAPHLSWLDVLHEGPVPAVPPDELRERRAWFIAACGWDDVDRARAALAARDRTLDRAKDHEEVVLWFEHDLFDQLQLLDVLTRLERADLPDGAVSLVQAAQYLGQLDGGTLRSLFARRQPLTAEVLAFASNQWAAFTSSDPRALAAAAARETTDLPFVAPALRRLLEEFPAPQTGLSRCERQALEAFTSPRSLGDAFGQAREEPTFLGDTVFAWHLERLSGHPAPLLRLEGGTMIRVPREPNGSMRSFWSQRAELTDDGRAVLAGDHDQIRLRRVDRWIGGVHLCEQLGMWRWDRSRGLTRDGDSMASTGAPQ